ncbi:hypothetical protein [Polyangium sp. y55x31]|uniref:hypothetical protein n=1 Tax=Polyangium sp. y55x31 TaxID=3042688 RepID=UPI002482F917|nr:hypothetical protein [Polyangium sp. y55x31]MDI1480796.1 hypothetical protein [Polyangium sp. y55x31]
MRALRGSFVGAIVVGIMHVAAGCGGPDEPPGAGGGGAGGGGGGGGSGGEPITCSFEVASHDVGCPEGSCPITTDVEVRCTEREFGAAGLRVAAAPTGTFLGTSSHGATYLFEITPSGGSRIEAFPMRLDATSMILAQDPSGAVYAVGDETTIDGSTSPVGYPNGLVLVRPDGSWFVKETVADRDDRYVPVYDFEIDPTGIAYVWYASEPPSGISVARRAVDGNFSSSPVPTIGEGSRFTIDASGAPVSLGFIPNGSFYDLAYGDPPEVLTGLSVPSPVAKYRVTQAPASVLGAGVEPFVAVVQHDVGLHVVWPSGQASDEIEVADTNVPAYVCPFTTEYDLQNATCPAPCHETATGIENGAFAITRTADGKVWLAWIVSHLDYMRVYQKQCFDSEQMCICGGLAEEVKTKNELVIARYDPGQPLVEPLLTLPIDAPSTYEFYSDLWTDVRLLDIRAFENEVAVGVRLEDEKGIKVRVLRIQNTP